MAKDGFAAVELGRLLGATAQEVNRLLADQGFHEKVDGGWRLTSKGAELAMRTLQSSSNLPQAKSWDATYWPKNILEMLDTSAPALAKARTGLASDRLARAAARAARIDDADAIASQAADALKAASRGLDGKVVGYSLAGAAVVTVIGLAISLPIRRAKAARRDTQRQVAGDTTPSTEPDGEADAP
ncbi:hypothetical protein MT356_20665 [Rathayibacter festucae]|uniref:hypothetical protein n=1 Tax=Rathayibacter festucae TaxID=110937 RepID=UPI001FB281FF|nr:hypothetical protein [Rathayibacter festucae]MCJ1702131.1 hypothetical protein [Rathayibacter festucae]